MATRTRIAVIGAGYTGLVAAWRLAASGYDVEILERGADTGGLAGDFRMHGGAIEKAYHVVVPTDEHLIGLIDEVGLRPRLAFHPSRVASFHGGRVYPFNGPLDLLRYEPLALHDRLRAGLVIWWLQHTEDGARKFGRITASRWMRRCGGRAVHEVLWEPLLRGKFDRYADTVSMQWLWARIKQRVDVRDPKKNGETLGALEGGFYTLTQALVERIGAAGGRIRLSTPVRSLRRDPASGRVQVGLANGSEAYDRVVFTGPSPIFAQLIEGAPEVAPRALEQLRAVPYLGAVSLVFSTRQEISPYYWHNINAPNWPFLVFINQTCMRDRREFDGRYVYYIASYVDHASPLFDEPEASLVGRWLTALGQMFPAFDAGQVEERHLFRLRHAQHVVGTGYTRLIPPYRSALPGAYLANFSQIFPQDRGTNYSVREGDKIARLVADDVRTGGWPA